MKQVVVFGDLTSDKTSEQYPTVTLCEECIRGEKAKEGESQIVSIAGDAGPDDGPCEWCGDEHDI